jgi:hypothetical protein
MHKSQAKRPSSIEARKDHKAHDQRIVDQEAQITELKRALTRSNEINKSLLDKVNQNETQLIDQTKQC